MCKICCNSILQGVYLARNFTLLQDSCKILQDSIFLCKIHLRREKRARKCNFLQDFLPTIFMELKSCKKVKFHVRFMFCDTRRKSCKKVKFHVRFLFCDTRRKSCKKVKFHVRFLFCGTYKKKILQESKVSCMIFVLRYKKILQESKVSCKIFVLRYLQEENLARK